MIAHAFAHPVTRWITLGVTAILVLAPLVVLALRPPPALRAELWKRCLSWMVMAPVIIVPVLLGRHWTIAGVALVSAACYREFARATGLRDERLTHAVVLSGIAAVSLAVLDRWYGLFLALAPLGIGAIATSAILVDRPAGYLRRVGLGALAFMLFGCGLGHLGFLANDPAARPMLLMLIACVQLNDVFAFVAGKTFGRHRLAPNTSPGKTREGAIGALVLTAPLAALLGHAVFRGTPLDRPAPLLLLGALLGVVGVLGDLTLSSIKRDLGIKDMGATIPGHGGVLDRVNSLLFTAPVFFHYVVHAGGATAGVR